MQEHRHVPLLGLQVQPEGQQQVGITAPAGRGEPGVGQEENITAGPALTARLHFLPLARGLAPAKVSCAKRQLCTWAMGKGKAQGWLLIWSWAERIRYLCGVNCSSNLQSQIPAFSSR